nr:RNA ligase family protein [Motilibacter aurantiacus]
MLASSTRQPAHAVGEGWAVEVKLDGWRATVTVDDRGLRVRSRTGREVTAALPELAGLVPALGGRTLVLDGELVAGRGTAADFYALGPRMARRRAPSTGCRVTFVAFDLLWLDGRDLCAQPYGERRRQLEELAFQGPCWQTSASFDCPAEDLLSVCEERDLEGVVVKHRDSTYRPGARSRDWVKLKTAHWASVHAPRRQPGRERRQRA